jgi:hypothetical protein
MSGSRGAGDRPLTYAGVYDADRTYLPREVATVDGAPYMSLAKQSGVDPPGGSWLLLGGGGPVLYVSTLADGPPTDGSVFWYVTDETC